MEAQVSIEGKRISRVVDSKTEGQDWIRKTLNQIDQGLTFDDSNLTLAEYLKAWIAIKKNSPQLKSGFQYERLIDSYVVPMLGKIKLRTYAKWAQYHQIWYSTRCQIGICR